MATKIYLKPDTRGNSPCTPVIQQPGNTHWVHYSEKANKNIGEEKGRPKSG